jgi:hypothetical protein
MKTLFKLDGKFISVSHLPELFYKFLNQNINMEKKHCLFVVNPVLLLTYSNKSFFLT